MVRRLPASTFFPYTTLFRALHDDGFGGGAPLAMFIKRRKTRQIRVGNVPIGGGAPIVVQSMTTPDTADVKATVEQIHQLEQRSEEHTSELQSRQYLVCRLPL